MESGIKIFIAETTKTKLNKNKIFDDQVKAGRIRVAKLSPERSG